jgi:hypothetical protein
MNPNQWRWRAWDKAGKEKPVVYCAHATAQGARGRLEQDALTAAETQTTPDELAAKQRLDADERRQKKPRPLTAEERELAKSHPWESDE